MKIGILALVVLVVVVFIYGQYKKAINDNKK